MTVPVHMTIRGAGCQTVCVVGRLGEAGMGDIGVDWGDWRWGTWKGEWSWSAEDDVESVLLRWDWKDGAGIVTMTNASAGGAAPIGLFVGARRSFAAKAWVRKRTGGTSRRA